MSDCLPIARIPSVYDSYSGVYDFGNNFLITVKRDGDNLTSIVSEDKDKIPQRFLPFSDVSFYRDKSTGVLTFIRDAKGKVGIAVEKPKRPNLNSGSAAASLD